MILKKQQTIRVFIPLLIGVAIFISCTKQVPQNEKADQSKTTPLPVVRLSGGDTGLPTPFKHYMRGPGMAKMWLIYDSLLEKDETGDIPWLAESWDIDETGTSYTFHLQKNALWHDGEALTSEDVAFTFDYYREHPPVYNLLTSEGRYIVDKTKVIDPHTVEITFNTFDNTNLSKLGFSRIIPKHIWEGIDDPIAYDKEDAVVGSGPFVVESYSPEQGTYRYNAFDDYWGPAPAVSAIEWIPVSDPVLAFESEHIDLLYASADLLSRYRGKEEYKVESRPSYHSYRLLMNMEKRPELLDRSLRQAMAYGINRQGMVDKVYRGSAGISSMGYIPPESSWYNPDTKHYDWDPEKARQLLGGKHHIFKLLTGNSPSDIKTAELIKLDLTQVGIDIDVESVDSKVRDSTVQSGNYELLLIYDGGLGGDPDYLRPLFAIEEGGEKNELMGYHNATISRLAQAQATERDPAKRRKMIFELQKLIADEVPAIMLTGAVMNFVYRPAKYEGWMFRYDHNMTDHNKLSYLQRY